MALVTVFLFLILQAPSPISLIIAVLCHETAHFFTSLILSGQMPHISVMGAGLRMCCPGLYSVTKQLSVSLAGPLCSLLLSLLFHNCYYFSIYSLSLFFINLFPCAYLDGGQILSALLYKYLEPCKAYYVCRTVSLVSYSVIFIFNCSVQLKFGTNLTLLCFTIFLTLTLLGKDR